jgi:hypothetical protein
MCRLEGKMEVPRKGWYIYDASPFKYVFEDLVGFGDIGLSESGELYLTAHGKQTLQRIADPLREEYGPEKVDGWLLEMAA